MYAISDLFTLYLQQRNREWLVKANIAGTDYSNDVIVDFEVENSLVSGVEFELGTAIISRLTIRLKTTAEIAANAKVVPYIAIPTTNLSWQNAKISWQNMHYPWSGGSSEWLPLGEFYIDDREEVNGVWTFVCLDKLVWANVPYISALTYPATMQDMWDEICTSLGYTSEASVVIDPTYTIPVAPTGYTKRQVMGYIASANAASVYMGKDGKVAFRTYNTDDAHVMDLSDAEYFRAEQTNPEKSYTKIIVTYDVDNQLTYEAGSGDDNHTLTLVNPLMTQAMTDDLLTQINGYLYVPATMDARAYPQLEAGDRLRYGRAADELTWEEADTAWEDTDYSWDAYLDGGYTIALHTVYSFKGGLKMAVEAPSKSEQQSEFDVDGSLTTAMKDIRKNAVRTDKAYFGVTITSDDGEIIERSDKFSKAVFNSDEFAMKVGDGLGSYTDAVYFDPSVKKYKFNGTLEAVDGIFSGELSAVTGTFAGELSAASGTFEGTINGGSFVGGTIAIGSGNNIFKADGNGIYLGHADFASAPFRVTQLGSLVAIDADIEGHIAATSGSIAGWTIEADKLSGSGEIEGGTITGALIQTAAAGTYPRVALNSDDNLFNAEASGTNYIQADPDDDGNPILYFVNGSTTGKISAIAGYLAIQTLNNEGKIQISSGDDLELFAATGKLVRFEDWDKIYSNGDTQSLQSALNAKANTFSGRTGSALVKASDGTTNLELVFSNGICTAINVL